MDMMNYMDWKPVLVNEIAGTLPVFIILGLIALLYICAKARFPNQLTMMVMILFILLMSPFMGAIISILLIVVGAIFTLMFNHIIGNK